MAKSRPALGVWARIDSNVVNIIKDRTGAVEAVTNRSTRHAGPMLLPREVLFFYRCHELSIEQQARVGVGMKSIYAKGEHLIRTSVSCGHEGSSARQYRVELKYCAVKCVRKLELNAQPGPDGNAGCRRRVHSPVAKEPAASQSAPWQRENPERGVVMARGVGYGDISIARWDAHA
jgi:hypothetical protein